MSKILRESDKRSAVCVRDKENWTEIDSESSLIIPGETSGEICDSEDE